MIAMKDEGGSDKNQDERAISKKKVVHLSTTTKF
jgi:hypothetical protein